MKKAYLTAVGSIELRNEPAPVIERDDEVRIRVHSVGVCGSDMHYFRSGRIGRQIVKFPWAVGHECAGVIDQAGPSSGLAAGTRVAVDPLAPCLACDQCAGGREHTCRNQKFLGVPDQMPGAMAEYLVLPGRCCVAIPDSMTFHQAVMTEPFAIALWAVKLAGDVAGKSVGILGSGPVGLCVLEALKLAGAGRVFATDLLDYRVALAAKMGAAWSGKAEDVEESMASRCPLGLDVVFECAGDNDAIDQAARLLAPGGLLVLVGIPEGDRISFDMNYLRRKELRVQNVRRQNGCTRRAVELTASGRANLDPIVTHRYEFDRSQEAFDTVSRYADGVVKAMIDMVG
ncbi:MAG: alcohol dehydrogenase catalytic domain-containing protein [Planctomycetes bacterium]|mgnify:CR=1|nr:alcohol dehydrogenase catalytic domain-containing protein [Planctomycetota bacterium]